MKCNRCGNTDGYFTTLKGIQYYNGNGEPIGCDVDCESKIRRCNKCDKILTDREVETK